MYEIIDKILLLLCCTTLYLFQGDSNFVVVPVIIAIVLSSLFIYYDNTRFKLAGYLLYSLLCFLFPDLLIFLPMVVYDILNTRYQYAAALIPFIIIYHLDYYEAISISFTFVFFVVAYLLKYKTDNLKRIKSEYNDLRDNSTKMSRLLEEQNQSLLQNQDYEINLATLNERNRISKEIHDSIGHMLSRALLQVGALLTVTREDLTREGLSALKESLSDGMDQIRSSIHNMYDDSIDLYVQIEYLVKNFTFCPITFDYDIKEQPSLQLKHSLIAITKECLSNIMKHSDATRVSIILREHPAMYQLIIHDNASLDETSRKILSKAFERQEFDEGMGLRNITDRVKSFNGNINVTLDQGYKLFISIPKKQNEDNRR